MTLQEAVKDKNRPLSVSPHEWMQYEQAKQHEEEELIQKQVKRIIEDENPEQNVDININAEEKLDIGIEQMILGCRISMKALQQLDRQNVTASQRPVYNEIKSLIYNAVAPYLADILKSRKGLYK